MARTCSSNSTACVQDKVKVLTRHMADGELSQTDAAQLLRDSGCDKWSAGSLGRLKRERPGQSPLKGGKQTYLPFAEGKSVEFWKDIGQAQNLKRALSSLGDNDIEDYDEIETLRSKCT